MGPKKIFGLKKNSESEKFFGSKKNFSSEKNFGSEKNSGSKKNWGKKMLTLRNILGQKKILGLKFFWSSFWWGPTCCSHSYCDMGNCYPGLFGWSAMVGSQLSSLTLNWSTVPVTVSLSIINELDFIN